MTSIQAMAGMAIQGQGGVTGMTTLWVMVEKDLHGRPAPTQILRTGSKLEDTNAWMKVHLQLASQQRHPQHYLNLHLQVHPYQLHFLSLVQFGSV